MYMYVYVYISAVTPLLHHGSTDPQILEAMYNYCNNLQVYIYIYLGTSICGSVYVYICLHSDTALPPRDTDPQILKAIYIYLYVYGFAPVCIYMYIYVYMYIYTYPRRHRSSTTEAQTPKY